MYTLVHSVTFTVPQYGQFEYILSQEEQNLLRSGDIMGYSIVYSDDADGILYYTSITCPGQPTNRYTYTLAVLDTMDITEDAGCREYSMQAIFDGKAHRR